MPAGQGGYIGTLRVTYAIRVAIGDLLPCKPPQRWELWKCVFKLGVLPTYKITKWRMQADNLVRRCYRGRPQERHCRPMGLL